MWTGTRRLVLLNVVSPAKQILRGLTTSEKLSLSRSPHGGAPALFDDCVACAADKLIADAKGPAWDELAFTALLDQVRAGLYEVTWETVTRVERVLGVWHTVQNRMSGPPDIVTDIEDQLKALIHTGFVTETGYQAPARPPPLPARAVERRLEKLADDVHRDRALMHQIHDLEDDYRDLAGRSAPGATERGGDRGDPLDAGGTAGELLRPDTRHPHPGVGETHQKGDGSAMTSEVVRVRPFGVVRRG